MNDPLMSVSPGVPSLKSKLTNVKGDVEAALPTTLNFRLIKVPCPVRSTVWKALRNSSPGVDVLGVMDQPLLIVPVVS